MTTLRHIHLRSWPQASPPRFPSYAQASAVQAEIQQQFFAWKNDAAAAATAADASSNNKYNIPPAPRPTLITFTPTPTYTLGRRQTEPLSAAELARLRKPLTLRYVNTDAEKAFYYNNDAHHYQGVDSSSSRSSSRRSRSRRNSNSIVSFPPAVEHAPRGGLATYHGPGQVVFWPVLDLRAPRGTRWENPPLSVRDYACLLEQTTIAALERAFGIPGLTTTANPGVWVRRSREGESRDQEQGRQDEKEREGEGEEQEERKIAALGVHLRRHVTGLGVAVNLAMPTAGPDEATNPWARIDACGLGDKGVTSVAAELRRRHGHVVGDGSVAALYDALMITWVAEFASRLRLNSIVGAEASNVLAAEEGHGPGA